MKHKYRKYRFCFDFANLALVAEINPVLRFLSVKYSL